MKRALPRDFDALFSLWRHRQPELWAQQPKHYIEVGKRILERGEPLLAYDIFQEGIAASPKNPELLRLLALSLARSGATSRACEILTGLYRRGWRDEETMGILARTHKDLAASALTAREGNSHRASAHDIYLRSYRAQHGYYAGINAAALALLLGRHAEARRLAREVREICLARSRRERGKGGETYWLAATLGECSLILGDTAQAEHWYARAARAGRGRYADLASTARQARLIIAKSGLKRFRVEDCLKIPRVVAFTGHRIDPPGRRWPRFPASAEAEIRAKIAQRLEALDAGFGYASAAGGSDIIFLEEMLKRGGEIHIVLPCSPAEFKAEAFNEGAAGWGARFERVLRRAVRVHIANDHGKAPGDIGYVYANLMIDGLARLKAASLGAALTPLAVWNKEKEEGPGGTGSLVRHWRRQGLAPEIILPSFPAGPRRARARKVKPEVQSIKAVLFADVVGYSKLREGQIPAFVNHFMALPGRLLRRLPRPPEARTWGDALYFVFDDVANAGRFALDLSEAVRRVSWTGHGLPENLSFRISLHAGPVYRMIDPVTGQVSFTGAHVTRGARIEPIVPPGQIYTSQAFAALSAANGVRSFFCEYVGEVPVAKKFGVWPLYHLRRGAGLRPTR